MGKGWRLMDEAEREAQRERVRRWRAANRPAAAKPPRMDDERVTEEYRRRAAERGWYG